MTEGRELAREVLRISWPMIISELSDSLYSIADTYFVSKLGTAALAAVGLSSYIAWLFFVVIALTSIGTLIFVSQSYGAKEFDKARTAVGEALIVALVFSGIVSFIATMMVKDVLKLFTNDTRVVELGTKYLKIRLLGLSILNLAFILDSSLRAIGATKYSMIAILSSAILNIILDPLLIFGLLWLPALGVEGAALATLISILYMLPLELYFVSKLGIKPKILRIRFRYASTILRLSIPAAIERFIFSIGNNLYIAAIARCGTIALAAHQVGIRIESFIYLPGFAFSVASAALVGQRVGASDINGAKRVGIEATKLCVFFMGSLGITVALLSRYIVVPFAPNKDVAELASIYLILAGLSEPGLALAMTLSGGIRGGGNTLMPMLINAVCLYTFRVLPANLLVDLLGVIGPWLAMFIDVYIRGVLMAFLYIKFFERIVRRVV